MEKREKNSRDYYVVDLAHIFKSLWRRIWIIALTAILGAAIGFSVASFLIPPKYSSSVLLYVNNNSISVGNTSFNITASEITAAQSLVNTYGEILESRTTLERVIDKAGVKYSYRQLAGMIASAPANETEIMKVTVTAEDPEEAARIANCIAEILPQRIDEIIDGATMEVVDYAVPEYQKISPSITRYTAVGFLLGLLLSVIALVIVAMMDDTIHDEEYVLRTYDYPILAKVPDLLDSGSKRYGYYYSRRRHRNAYAAYAEETQTKTEE